MLILFVHMPVPRVPMRGVGGCDELTRAECLHAVAVAVSIIASFAISFSTMGRIVDIG